LAVIEESGAREGHDVEHNWHYGWDCYHPEQRWIALFPSGYKVISCPQDGFQLQAPEDAAQLAVFNAIRQKYKVGDDLVLWVPQTLTGDAACDEEDRIKAAASLLKDLIAGLFALASNNLPQAAGTTA
jgi:hypothetical protein